VSGLVTADLYQVRLGKIIRKQVAQKKIEIRPVPGGGTVTGNIPFERQQVQALPDEKILELASLGGKIRDYYGSEQDIEWCLENDKFYIVQSRPVTSLYPVPEVQDDKAHILFSFGHVQMMTEAIKPLGISVLRTIFPFVKNSAEEESRILLEAGGRLYADLSLVLQYKLFRKAVGAFMPSADVMMAGALKEYMEREEFKKAYPGKRIGIFHVCAILPLLFSMLNTMLFSRVENRIGEVNKVLAEHLKLSRSKLQQGSGKARIVEIRKIVGSCLPDLYRLGVVINIGAGIISYKLIEGLNKKWLGDVPGFAGISKSPPGNVTTEMGLALGDVSDAIRKDPAVAEYLEHSDDSTFWEDLKCAPGTEEAHDALVKFFEKYGMRCTGEIDITRPRWREVPTQLVPAILSSVKSAKPGVHRLDFENGRKESEDTVKKLLEILRTTHGGFLKMRIMRRLIKVHRSVIGLRERPKYHIVQIFDMVKVAILEEADELVKDGILASSEEIFWLSLQEIEEIMETRHADRNIINSRRDKFESETNLAPPRVITSEGEIITAKACSNVPQGALSGSPASAGIIEGRARVVLKMEDAILDKGDILVAPYTDPAWTPLFPLSSGLVTEVGGLMTHGAVVAREYGIPAVVGIDKATEIIRDGSYIRVNGTEGYVEIIKK
jgi:pyruvate,water dikinase